MKNSKITAAQELKNELDLRPCLRHTGLEHQGRRLLTAELSKGQGRRRTA